MLDYNPTPSRAGWRVRSIVCEPSKKVGREKARKNLNPLKKSSYPFTVTRIMRRFMWRVCAKVRGFKSHGSGVFLSLAMPHSRRINRRFINSFYSPNPGHLMYLACNRTTAKGHFAEWLLQGGAERVDSGQKFRDYFHLWRTHSKLISPSLSST